MRVRTANGLGRFTPAQLDKRLKKLTLPGIAVTTREYRAKKGGPNVPPSRKDALEVALGGKIGGAALLVKAPRGQTLRVALMVQI